MKRAAILIFVILLFVTSCGMSAGTHSTTYSAKSGNGGDVVIVVDAGHGANDNGTEGTLNGTTYYEKNLNLKIAKYLWESLAEYSGVKVYMTRYDDSRLSILSRTQVAGDLNADLMVSMHMNALENKNFKGSEIFVPKGNYRPELAEEASAIAEDILSEFEKAGMRNIGVKTSLMEHSEFYDYPNGMPADYYGILRYCVMQNIPSMIIEHGYLSNKDDLTFLTKDANLKRLAEATARCIARAYGLTKGSGSKITLQKQEPVTISDIPTTLRVGQDPIDLSAYGGSGSGIMRFETNDAEVLRIYGDKLVIYGEGTANITAVRGTDGKYLPEISENHIRITVLASGQAPVTPVPTPTPYTEPSTRTPTSAPTQNQARETMSVITSEPAVTPAHASPESSPGASDANRSITDIDRGTLYIIAAVAGGIIAAIIIAIIIRIIRVRNRRKAAMRMRAKHEKLYGSTKKRSGSKKNSRRRDYRDYNNRR